MTAPRGLAVAALLAVIAVVAVILLRDGATTTYRLRFQDARQLVKDDDVQVGGRRAGSVRDISLTDDNQAEVKIAVDRDFAALHEGTTATIRATSLSGIANRYIALAPGANSRPALPGGTVLRTDATTSIVDLDQLFDMIDPSTRRALQQLIAGNARWYAGRGAQANEAARYLDPALSSTRRLVDEVVADQDTFNAFLRSSSRTVSALAQRRDDLARLVTNANATARAIGDENAALASLAGLEPAIREHLAGYRSHSALLAGAAAVAVVVPLYLLTGLPQVGLLAVGAVVYSLGFYAPRRAFQAKTGGIGFRV